MVRIATAHKASNRVSIFHFLNAPKYSSKSATLLNKQPALVKNTFIVPNDAHYYKIIEMLKQFKIITLAPTCFGSRRSHH